MSLRRVNNFDEINASLRELYEFVDLWRTYNVDFRQRRIINAHPSIDDYDYVVRKELIDRIGGGLTPRKLFPGEAGVATPAKASNWDKITFGIGIGRSIEVGSNATPPYIWTNSRKGRAKIIAAACNIPPQGDDLIINIMRSGALISELTIPENVAPQQVVHSTTQDIILDRYDIVTCNVSQTGDEEGGRDVEIVVFCDLI